MVVTNDTCPISKAAQLLGDVWSLLIVRDLLTGPKRNKQLQDSLVGISTRTLTLKLKKLEAYHIIERRSYPETPPRVEYALTEKGLALHDIAEAMRAYGKKYL